AAHPVGRNIDFTRCEGEPRDTFAHADGEMESSAADERDQGGCIDGPHDDGSRHPAPAFIDEGPASVVEGSESPRLIVDPAPSPGRNSHPMAVAIGSPFGCHAGRTPDRTITGNVVPAPVFVEIFVAGHLGRNVVGSLSAVLALIALHAPTL